MSVLIKGMEIPDTCLHCPFADGEYGLCDCDNDIDVCYDERPDACPLIALPDHHGRLMDADAFKADYGMKDDCEDCEKEMKGKAMACEYDYIYSKMDFCRWIDDAPTIVDLEGENADHN